MTSIDPSTLSVNLEEKERWRRTLSVTVPASTVKEERQKALAKLGTRIKLPGFRSGHVPSSVVERRFGGAVQQEVLDQVIGDAYKEALRLQSISPISQGEVDDIQYEPDQDLVFSISFDVQPEIEIGRLGGFAVERPSAEVDDEAVDQVLDRLRDQNAQWHPVDEGQPNDGELVSVRVTRIVDGEADGEAQDYDLTLGDGEAIPDVENAIRTLEVGGTDTFDVTFPDDFPTEERRGEQQVLQVELIARKTKELPGLDDSFARSIGDFEDLETLRTRVREDLETESKDRSDAIVRGALIQNVMEANPFDVPASMIERYMESILGDTAGVDAERVADARRQLGPEAEHAVKRFLLIDKIAEQQGLAATEEDLDAHIEEIAEKSEQSQSELYARLQKAGRLEEIERAITERKVFELLESQSEIVDAG